MQALEMIADITNHRLTVENATLPVHAERARVIVLWDALQANHGKRTPPPSLAGMGKENGDILAGQPESDWEILA